MAPPKKRKSAHLAEARKIAAEVDTWPDWKKAGFQIIGRASAEAAIRADERAKVEAEVVAHHRAVAQQYRDGDCVEQCDYTADAYDAAANDVERGEHRAKGGAT